LQNEAVYNKKQMTINHLKKYIYDRISEHERNFDSNNIRDFVDLYVNVSKQEDSNISSKLLLDIAFGPFKISRIV
jgi:predicted solute-binding protein